MKQTTISQFSKIKTGPVITLRFGNINFVNKCKSTQLSIVLFNTGLTKDGHYLSAEKGPDFLSQGILECIDKALDVFGASVRQVVYWGLEHEYGMKKTDVPTRPDVLCRHLEEIFGAGSEIVERSILRTLGVRFRIANLEQHNLVRAIQLIREELRKK